MALNVGFNDKQIRPVNRILGLDKCMSSLRPLSLDISYTPRESTIPEKGHVFKIYRPRLANTRRNQLSLSASTVVPLSL